MAHIQPVILCGGSGLNALIDKGLVKMQNFSRSKNKFGYVYLLTPKGISEKITLTSKFLVRKQAEYEALKAEIESLKAQSDISEAAQRFVATRSSGHQDG